MPLAIDQLRRILETLALVRDLLKEFPSDATLLAMRAELIAQARATLSP